MPTVDINSVRLHYESFGDPSLPAVLLIMGLGMPASAWPQKLISKLLEKGLRVITVDNRDSGLSERFDHLEIPVSVPVAIGRTLLRLPVSAPYTLEDMALDLAHLLDYLEISRVHIVGASMGGMIAQVLATIRPSRVSSLTSIMSASGNPRTGFGKLKAIYSILVQSNQTDDAQNREKHLTEMFMTLKSPKYEYETEEKKQMISNIAQYPLIPGGEDRQLLAILASGDRSTQLARLSVPTLVIHGEDDPLLPLSAGKEVADLIHGSKFMQLSHMGHDMPPMYFDVIADAIAALVWTSES